MECLEGMNLLELTAVQNLPSTATSKSLICSDALQARKLAKSYEEAGGEYENEPGSKNEPRKGSPKPKSETRKNEESGRERTSLKESEQREKDKEDKPEENSEKKPSGTKGGNKVKARKKVEAPADGSRRSARLGNKRRAHESESGDTEDDGAGEEDSVEEKAPKKRKNTTKK